MDINNKLAIVAKDLSKSFGNRVAVENLNLEVSSGEIFSLLGTNGAGKTTTIKMLSCLLMPTMGSAWLMGNDVINSPLKVKEQIGVSPQETAIAGHLNPLENLLLIGGVYGLSSTISRERAKSLLELMELENRKNEQSSKLSGGMQRRLSIAMALMPDPQILFLDEPTLGLDPHSRKSIWKHIENMKGQKTIFLTTHYLEEADALADRIAIMDKGKIIAMGTSNEIKSKHLSKKTIGIVSQDITESIVNELVEMGNLVTRTSNRLEIVSDKVDLYALFDFFKSRSLLIDEVEMKKPSLDEVFIQLTGKGVEQ